MEASISTKNKQYLEHLDILKSDNGTKIIDLIKDLRSKGDGRYIEPLIQSFCDSQNNEVKEAIYGLLLDLKDDTALEPLISCIRNEGFKDVRIQLLSVLWQSKLDASTYLVELIEMAVEFDYLECIEIMTILDTFEDGFSEEELMNSIYALDEAIMEDQSSKSDLLNEIKSIVNRLMVD